MPRSRDHVSYVPAGPIVELANRHGRVATVDDERDERDLHIWRAIARAEKNGRLKFQTADKICTYYGEHMSFVYGDLYWTAPLGERGEPELELA